MIFFKIKDKYSQEEYDEMRKKLQEMNVSKKEEHLIIWTALKTLLPGVLLAIVLVWGVLVLFIYFLVS